jgi:3-methyladenine DNA glycosylase Tag
MQGPPERIAPQCLADYLEALTKAVFDAGLSWRVVESKWPGFVEAFHGFDPAWVAGLTPPEIEALEQDRRIVRNRAKIEATVSNAATMIELEAEHGGFRGYLRSHGGYEATVADMKRRFRYVGDSSIYHFLYVVGEPTPEHEEWMAQHSAHRR